MAANGQTIQQQAATIVGLFEAFIIVCPPPIPNNHSTGHTPAEDQLGRFRIWAGNIGVNAQGHASLDYRLRESQGPREVMVGLLGTLENHVRRAIDTSRPLRDDVSVPSSSIAGGSGMYESHNALSASAVSSSFHGTETESLLELMDLSPFDSLLRAIEQDIDRLYRLSVAIRQPSLLNQDKAAARFVMRDEEGNENEEQFQEYSLRRCAMEFPEAGNAKLKRISKAITFRRRRFQYRTRHQTKLGADAFQNKPPSGYPPTELRVGEKASQKLETINEHLAANEGNKKRKSRAGRSQASATTATTLPQSRFRLESVLNTVSGVSTAFPASQMLQNCVPVPNAPEVKAGSKEFECPYCCLMMPVETAQGLKWRRHVMNDIEPYVCIFENCGEGHTLFRERSAWVNHMQEKHTTQFSCTAPSHRASPFVTNDEHAYEEHMYTNHAGAFTKAQLIWLKKQSQSTSDIIMSTCPLCGHIPPEEELERESVIQRINLNQERGRNRLISSCLIKHVALHLEQISLISLPWQNTSRQLDQSESSASSRVEKDSLEHETETTTLTIDEEATERIRHETLDEWSKVVSQQKTSGESVGETEEKWEFIESPDYFGHARDPVLQPFLRKWYVEAAPVSTFPGGPLLPICLMPLNPTTDFFGRETELKVIESFLLPDAEPSPADLKPMTFPRTLAVHAPGGMGKTQVAMQFVTRHREEFDAIFWIYADDQTKLIQDFKNIAIQLGLVDKNSVDAKDLVYTRDLVKSWLINPVKNLKEVNEKNAQKAKWLLVFDGVEEPSVLNDCWPYDGPGSVLLTSRYPFHWKPTMQLKPFTTEEATQFLMRLTNTNASFEERRAIDGVSYRLGGLPLALVQMAGTIQHKQLSFSEFLDSYNKWSHRVQFPLSTTNSNASSGYQHTIATVWAFDNLVRGQELLNIISMLDPDSIAEEILTAPLRDSDLGHFPQSWSEFVAARNELMSCSLLSRTKSENHYFIHRLVQDVARERMNPSDFRKYLMMCVRLISSLWPYQPFDWRHGTGRWAMCEQLFPHIARLRDLYIHSPEHKVLSDDDYVFAKLLTDAGWYHHERGHSSEADLFNDASQSICENLQRHFVSEAKTSLSCTISQEQVDDILAEIQHNRGSIAVEINKPQTALVHHGKFNEMMARKYKDKPVGSDMRLAISWNGLGNCYMLMDEWDQSQECFDRSIMLMKQLDDFQEVLLTLPLINIGLLHWIRKDYDEAEKILLKGLRDREAAFGSDDRVSFITGRFFHALGNVKDDQKKPEESQTYHHRALMHYKFTLGNNHHRTADALVKVAYHHLVQGQPETALALIDHSIKIYASSTTNTFAAERARASFRRAQALRLLNREEDADAELSDCYREYIKIIASRDAASTHPKPKSSPKELAEYDLVDLVSLESR